MGRAGFAQRHCPAQLKVPSFTLADMQEELERVRKLFEFVEGVMPKDAQEAMRFFNSRNPSKLAGDNPWDEEQADGVDIARPLGPAVEMERHRARLEEHVRGHRDALQRELVNLTTVVKAVQRDVEGFTV